MERSPSSTIPEAEDLQDFTVLSYLAAVNEVLQIGNVFNNEFGESFNVGESFNMVEEETEDFLECPAV